MNVYAHSGKLGDIVYALPAVRALGPGMFVVKLDGPEISNDEGDSILPLLKMQPYITDVGRRGEATHDFDCFRVISWMSIAHDLLTVQQARPFGAKITHDPWLRPGEGWVIGKHARTVVARSPRYHNPAMDWGREMSQAVNPVFVGSWNEYQAFPVRIPYLATESVVDLAKAIYESEGFIGNQSFPLSLAVGLGVPARMERAPGHHNCDYPGVTVLN